MSPQKKVFMIFVEQTWQAKIAQQLFGQVRENLSKNPSHPQNFACSYTYDLLWRNKDAVRLRLPRDCTRSSGSLMLVLALLIC